MEAHLLLIEDFVDILLRHKDASDDREVTGDVGQAILRDVEQAPLKKPEVFQQQRGQEYEQFVAMLNAKQGEALVKPFLEDEEFFKICLEIRRSGRMRQKRNV